MTAVTILVSLAGAVAAFLLPPLRALYVYCAILLWYPQPLTVSLGSIDFSSSRIVMMGLMGNLLLRSGRLRATRWEALDVFVVVAFGAAVVSYFLHAPAQVVIEHEGGMFFDSMLPYFAVRMVIQSRRELIGFLWALAVIAAPLGVLGIMHAQSGHNPYGFMLSHLGWGLSLPAENMRLGLWRASASFLNPIAFGLFFAAVGPMMVGLWPVIDRKRRGLLIVLFAATLIGLFSSLSSAPFFSFAIAMGMIAVFPLRRFWPIVAVVVIGGIVFLELFSNRHFYHVFTRFALNPETAYYRIALLDEALGGGMRGHWLFGYGYVGIGPGYKSPTGFNWENQDLTNLYIKILAHVGLFGLIPFWIVNFLYYNRLFRAARAARTGADRWLIWMIAAALVGWNVTMMTVMPIAQIQHLFHMFIALTASLCYVYRTAEAHAPAQTGASVAPAARYRRSWYESWSRRHA